MERRNIPLESNGMKRCHRRVPGLLPDTAGAKNGGRPAFMPSDITTTSPQAYTAGMKKGIFVVRVSVFYCEIA